MNTDTVHYSSAEGRCQTGQSRYDSAVTCGRLCCSRRGKGERKRERARDRVQIPHATTRKPSHTSVTHQAAKKYNCLL